MGREAWVCPWILFHLHDDEIHWPEQSLRAILCCKGSWDVWSLLWAVMRQADNQDSVPMRQKDVGE